MRSRTAHHRADCVCHEMSPLYDDILAVWPEDAPFFRTVDLVEALAEYAPARWSQASCYGRELTVQRMGRYLSRELDIWATKNHLDERGYCHHDFAILSKTASK